MLYSVKCDPIHEVVSLSDHEAVNHVKIFMDVEFNLEGTDVTFGCSPGLILTGPNATTCMTNRQWEPDPREVMCKGAYI